MNILDLNYDILGKIEEEVKIINMNKKFKNNYDDFVNEFKSQIEYYKYDVLSDVGIFGPHTDDRTAEQIRNVLDEHETTDLPRWSWPPLSLVENDDPYNRLD